MLLQGMYLNQNDTHDISARSLQFVIDFIDALDRLDDSELHLIATTFDIQGEVSFQDLTNSAMEISQLVHQKINRNNTTIN